MVDDVIKMKRMIFRASKGQAFFEAFEMEKILNNKKKIFLIVFPSSEQGVLMSKLLKLCDLFNASRFKVPSIKEFGIEFPQLENEIKTKEHILDETKTSAVKFIRQKIGEVR
jgi:hypothetical protein